MRGLLFLIIGSLFLFWFSAFYWKTKPRKAQLMLAIGLGMALLAALGFFKVL